MPHDKTHLTSFVQDNKESTKRARRREKMSLKVQKFIERKKREEMIKRSLEQTIEAEKHQKIQQNLKNLDKFVQQHLRQKSQPSVGHKKTSIVHSIFQGMQSIGEKEKRSKKQHKKNKRTQDQPIVGLSEIFYPDFANNSNPDLDLHDENAPDETAQQISPGKMVSLYHSAVEYPEQNISVVSTAGRGPKSKKPTSSSKSRRTKKSLNLEKTKDTTLGVRTASGSGVNGHLRKSSMQNPLLAQKKSSLNPSKQISVPLPIEKARTETGRDANKFSSSTQPRLVSKGQPTGEKSRWLEQKHPD